MSKLKTVKMIIKNFGFHGLLRSIINKIQKKPVLINVITEQYIRQNNISNEKIVNDNYVETAPCPQNIIDIFKEQWYSEIPIEGIISGNKALFDEASDNRIIICDNVYPVKGKTILELGPFECAHTYQLEKFGAASVTSIEANNISYLKCLIVKDLLKLNVDLLYGDFREYLKSCDRKYDIVLAIGMLYHMTNPVELLYDISQVADNIYVSTHYYTEERLDGPLKFDPEPVKLSDKYHGYKHYYVYPADSASIVSGGTRNYGVWLRKEDILSLLKEIGYNNIQVVYDGDHDPHGNALSVFAGKS